MPQYASIDTSHEHVGKKKEEKNTLHVLHGIQNFAVGLFEKYIALSTKTKTTSWPWANECPSKWNFNKTENRRKKRRTLMSFMSIF